MGYAFWNMKYEEIFNLFKADKIETRNCNLSCSNNFDQWSIWWSDNHSYDCKCFAIYSSSYSTPKHFIQNFLQICNISSRCSLIFGEFLDTLEGLLIRFLTNDITRQHFIRHFKLLIICSYLTTTKYIYTSVLARRKRFHPEGKLYIQPTPESIYKPNTTP